MLCEDYSGNAQKLLIKLLSKTGLRRFKKRNKKRSNTSGVVKQDCIRKDYVFEARQTHSLGLNQPHGKGSSSHQSRSTAFSAFWTLLCSSEALPAIRPPRWQQTGGWVNPLDMWQSRGGCESNKLAWKSVLFIPPPPPPQNGKVLAKEKKKTRLKCIDIWWTTLTQKYYLICHWDKSTTSILLKCCHGTSFIWRRVN